MISKTIGFRGTNLFSDTPIFPFSHHDITIFPYFSICLQSLTIFDAWRHAQYRPRCCSEPAEPVSPKRRSASRFVLKNLRSGGDASDKKIHENHLWKIMVDLVRINLWILVCWLIILDYSHPPTFEELGVSPWKMVVQESWRWRLI